MFPKRYIDDLLAMFPTMQAKVAKLTREMTSTDASLAGSAQSARTPMTKPVSSQQSQSSQVVGGSAQNRDSARDGSELDAKPATGAAKDKSVAATLAVREKEEKKKPNAVTKGLDIVNNLFKTG